jgi:hypothetical protein
MFFVLLVIPSASLLAPAAAQSGTAVATFGPITGDATPPPDAIITVAATPTALQTPTITATASAVEPTIPALPTLKSDLMGIQMYANIEVDRWWGLVDRAQFMGFKWIKFQVSWKEIEAAGKGVYTDQINVLREHLIYAGRRGFKMLISVVNAPDWARPAAARGQLDGPPANPQDYADFIAALLDQWGTDYISAIEIWNEPNLTREWTGAPMDAAMYRRYFDVAYNTIRARSPNIWVITAGLAPTGDTAGSVDDRRYLRDLYATGLPLNDPLFAIGIHPYGWANAPDARCCEAQPQGWDDQPYFYFLDTIYAYREIMLANNHAGGKLMATEFGWSTFDGLHFQSHIDGPPAMPPDDPGLGWMNRLTEAQQAEYIIRAFELAQTGDLASFMGVMVLWNMNFSSLTDFVKADQPSRPESGFSVLDADWHTRPIYNWLQAAPKQ